MKMAVRNLSFSVVLATGLIVGTLATGLSFAVPASAQNAQWNALFDRIIRLEASVKNLRRGGGGGGVSTGSASNGQLRQILSEIRQMRLQLRSMDGRIRRLELNQGRAGKLRRPVPRQLPRQRLPKRRTQLPTAQQAGLPPGGIQEYDEYGDPKITVKIGEPRAQNPVIARRPPANWQTGGSAPRVAPTRRKPRVNTQVSRLPQNPVIRPAPGQPVNQQGGVVRQTLDGNQQSASKRLYDRSTADFRSRRFGSAESGFKSFVRKYSKDGLASSAQFMLGETYYVQKNWRLAAQAYLQGYRRYPRGRRGGDSLLKLGMSLAKLGQKSQSCGAFERVVSQYKSSRSTVAQAKSEMRRGRC